MVLGSMITESGRDGVVGGWTRETKRTTRGY